MDATFSTLWALAQNATPATTGVFLLMWWLERQERRELRHERDALLERILNAMHDSKEAIRSLRLIVRGD